MFNDLTDATNISNITEIGAQIRSVVVDDNGNDDLGVFIPGSGAGQVVYSTDWSQTTDNTPDYAVPQSYNQSYVHMSAGEVNKMLVTRHTDTVSGHARVYDYNEETDEWGKFNADGTFVANTPYNMDKSGISGYYGLTSGISMDGMYFVVGGYNSSAQGCMYVWQFNNEIKEWGKFNADGSFATGEAHYLSINSSAGCHYGHGSKSQISHNGKRVATGGQAGSYNRIYIWDYDEETAQWCKIEQSTGNFVPRDGNGFLPNWITTPSSEAQGRMMSADGYTMLASVHTSTTSGNAYVWKYNKETFEWGKFNTDGSFTKDAYWDLSRSGVYGHYGLSCQ